MHAYASMQTREIQDGQERLLLCYDPERGCIRMALAEAAPWTWQDPPPKHRARKAWSRDGEPDEAFVSFERPVSPVP